MPPRRIQFGAFELDSAAGELRKHGNKIKLQEQPLQILQQLLEHPGEVVTREELQKRIWPADTFVDFDHGLYSAVQRLRDALGDSAETPRYVETLPRRGYRFIAPVSDGNRDEAEAKMASVEAPASAVRERPAPRRSLRVPMLVATGVILVALVVALAFRDGSLRERLLGKPAVPLIHSIVVLPLQNLSSDPSQEYFADGMTDALITDLAQIGSLKVISRTSTMHYKKSDKTLPEIARELNVDGIVEGTVQRSGDRVRITAQLIHGPSDKHVWASSFERDARDVLSMESEIAGAIANQIQTKLTPEQHAKLASARPINLKAFEAYLQGMHHLDRVGQGFGDEEQKKAAEYFQQAINADPNFVQAYIGLAYAHRGLFLPSNEDSAIMKRAAERAVELDPSSSDARIILGQLKAERWDWPGAEEEFRRGIALNPNNAEAHGEFADYLEKAGQLEEGWKEMQIAQELNPNPATLPSALNLPSALYYRGECDRAIELLLRVVESHPNDAQTRLMLSQCYEEKGMYKEAIEELGRAATLFGYPETGVRLQRAFGDSGYRGALLEFAQEIEHRQATKQMYMPAYLATVYARLGDKDRAFFWLEESYKIRADSGLGSDLYHWLKTDPMLKSIRSDPRYFDLLRRVGLPP